MLAILPPNTLQTRITSPNPSQSPPKPTPTQYKNPKISTNPFPWNTRIRTHVDKNQPKQAFLLYISMLENAVSPDLFTFPFLLKACSSLNSSKQGEQIHTHVVKNGTAFAHDVFIQNALLYMYSCFGLLGIARKVFDGMSQRTLVSWNSMIAGYSKFDGLGYDALLVFVDMLREGVVPDGFSFTVSCKACGSVLAVEEGIQIHSHVVKLGFESDVLVRNGLIDMYVKFDLVDDALRVFDRMPERNLVSWNALIGGLMRLGQLDMAEALFREMDVRDVVSWNSMISGYVQNGQCDEALALFQQMQLEGINPNAVTVVSALSACSNAGALSLGKWVHLYSEKNCFISNEFVNSSLVVMYARCGDIENAWQVFERMPKKDIVSWDVMIEGLAMHGQGKEALELFVKMRRAGVKPDEITLIGMLNACSHAGLVDEGLMYFRRMSHEFGIEPNLEHYACVVDLLGRVGRVNEALEIIKRMPIAPDGVVWGALLSACRTHNNAPLAESVVKHIIEMDPMNSGSYILLSNIYAARCQWEDVANVRSVMKHKGIEKEPGCSLIEIEGSVNEFLAGDSSHPQCDQIFCKLDELMERIKVLGYAPDLGSVLHNLAEEEKESVLYHHSEKLAVAFGLINTPSGMPIRVVKNLRICGDCHSAIKLIADIEAREIIVRDRHRFHRFKDGECSCGDYW
ncbi:pentatricopeptide repeat-containing protein At2g29760, chloroplastic-like [Magnolia sinica]|uniref:pentatricopeptide repeat-containing protein At2g29760, chloroplastic-like n=1 Tax=Magnolia sinica TaxID=86752 RepID=UPI0026598D53|nr:pentatricopeptide repeat-containing protein At2g29760, chloroplastic-like [Magnolia sinica]